MRIPRLHRYLWLLTGRCSGFVNATLNTHIAYDLVNESNLIARGRDFLQLRTGDTDYYVAGAMAAVYASISALRGLPTEESIMFLPGGMRIPPPKIVGATLSPMFAGGPKIKHVPSGIPAARVWTITCQDSASMEVRSDIGEVWQVPFIKAGVQVFPTWPVELGFNFGFRPVNDYWARGTQVTITAEPFTYPYESVARAAGQDPLLIDLLAANGMLEAFNAALPPIYKVGALAGALVLEVYKHSPVLQAARSTELMAQELSVPDWTDDPTPDTWENIFGALLMNGQPLTLYKNPLNFDPKYL